MTIRVDTTQCRKSVKRNDYIGEDDFLGASVFHLCLWVHSIVENIIVKTSLEIGKREFDSIFSTIIHLFLHSTASARLGSPCFR